MSLPTLTSLQFLTLSALGVKKRPGREIRGLLEADGVRKSLPAFYQLMARLEDSGLVEAVNVSNVSEGRTIVERWYKVTGDGIKALHSTRDFYADRDLAAASKGAINRA